METYKTAGGKEIEVYHDPATAHVKIKFKEGGQLPAELTGVFTSKAVAEVAVRSYILNNPVSKHKENKEFEKELIKTAKKKKEVDGSED
jgi:hypothetical protein